MSHAKRNWVTLAMLAACLMLSLAWPAPAAAAAYNCCSSQGAYGCLADGECFGAGYCKDGNKCQVRIDPGYIWDDYYCSWLQGQPGCNQNQ
jgi:hypothetical protein